MAQDEIQSAYFGHSCFSIFTDCSYHQSEGVLKKYPITIVSEVSNHSHIAGLKCFNKVVEHMLEKIDLPVDKGYAWSDGMTAQFRSRFVLMLLSQFHETKNLKWHYMEAHHGKGLMDGVGCTIKNHVYKEVKSGRLVIDTSQEFAMAAQTLVPAIPTIYLPESEILQELNEIENAPVVPETLQILKVVRKFNSQGVSCIEFYKLPNESKLYSTQYYRNECDPIVCGHEEDKYVDDNTCAHCSGCYEDPDMLEWLQCSICSSWFHKQCFHL